MTVSIIDILHNPYLTRKYNFSFSLLVRLGLRRWNLPDDCAQNIPRAPNNDARGFYAIADNPNVPAQGRPVAGTLDIIHPLFAGFADSARHHLVIQPKHRVGCTIVIRIRALNGWWCPGGNCVVRAIIEDPKTRANSELEQIRDGQVVLHDLVIGGLAGVRVAGRLHERLLLLQDPLERVLQKKKTLMKTSGDANARKPTDDEVMKNNLTISDLFKLAVGSCFWILDYGTNNTIPARTPPTIQSPNPNHNGASYPVFRLNYKVVTSRIRKAGKERVYDVKCPGDRPPLGWNIRIVGNSIETSRVVVGGSRYVLCAVIRKVPSTKAKSNK